MKYKHSQKRRFNTSQRQHDRLMKKHSDCIDKKDGDYDRHFIRYNYHFAVRRKQSRENRILSEAERQKEYDRVISTFY